LWAIGVVLF
jgi:serine/threonine protein kinase